MGYDGYEDEGDVARQGAMVLKRVCGKVCRRHIMRLPRGPPALLRGPEPPVGRPLLRCLYRCPILEPYERQVRRGQ